MYGVVTRHPEDLEWPEFDRGFYEVKNASGREEPPLESAVNMVSCFADNAAADAEPDLVPVDREGNRATSDRPYFDWAYVCPSDPNYRAGLLEIIEDCAAANADVRLDDVGFPRGEYCHCERCRSAFAESDHEEWEAWRASVITAFVEEAAARVPGRLSLTLHPDPYPGHLHERAGLDLPALEAYVDEFVVPLYDTHYGTTYWLETIASGFETALSTPFSVELYAVNIGTEELIHATEVAAAYGDDVLFGYDAGVARGAIRRMRADEREGVSHGDPAR